MSNSDRALGAMSAGVSSAARLKARGPGVIAGRGVQLRKRLYCRRVLVECTRSRTAELVDGCALFEIASSWALRIGTRWSQGQYGQP